LKCNFYGFVLPGDQVRLSVHVKDAPSQDLKVYGGVAEVDGKRKVKVEFQGNLVNLEIIEEVNEQKKFFDILMRKNRF
jgi:acyl dehydratase